MNPRTRSIADLEQIQWQEPGPDASLLVRRCYDLINKPLTSLTVADWRALMVQGIGLDFIAAPAVQVVEKPPLLKTEHFCGDLLVSLFGVGAEFFSRHPELSLRLEKLIDRLPLELNQLDFINFDTSSEALEEAIAEFRNRAG